ncbi:MAG: PH domain-containing protein [Saprospiraceae bacterium]|nr:PH domain-containing protein [Saprospiraceae bacterium]MCF8249832.1 PH domain-containing protein [Saprospiraceae bacterium]MCF8279498.1 PH domain-containing protein [Bacteroidales bacterium]MCF8311734.1 PH domain-containing protein [Saprospiraceae bacterium]MCF8440301.1 PH domain-containing protein [Saprospiraceae bacterium]
MSETHPFSQPTRQATVAILFILGGVLKMLVRQLWVVVLVFVFNKKSGFDGYTLFFLGLAGFTAMISLINYFNLYFYIKDGELVLEKGVFRKSKINVPLDRIQTVNFRQGIVHQFFNVVAVDIDTAGSAGKEFSLHAISKPLAEALREEVGKRSAVRQGGVGSSPTLVGVGSGQLSSTVQEQGILSDEAHAPNSRIPQLIFRLRPLDLVKIGASQNHLRTAGILMAFIIGFADDVEQALGMDLEKKLNWWLGTTDGSDLFSWLLVGVPFLLVVSFIGTLVRTVLQYFDLRFWRTERGFKIVSGLFTRQEVSAILTKIQYVEWSSSPLMRLFKMNKVRMPQAASVQVTGKLSVGLPGCYEPQLSAVRAAYFPEENDQNWESQGISKFNVWLRFLTIGPLPAFILVLITRSWMGSWSLVWLGWLLLAALLAWHWQRTWHWHVSEQGLRAEWGVWKRKSVLLQWYKIQSVSTHRGFFSSPTGRAKLYFYTAAGAVHIPYISVETAAAVQDFVLFKVESDAREWM